MYFLNNYNSVKYPIGNETTPGLRNAQIGAIHAIASFFTVEKEKVAIVVMPTGSGKTAVLMMSPYVLGSKKVLVVTPSRMVREQIFEDFINLNTLIKAKVMNGKVKKPKVFELKHLYDSSYEKKCLEADVIVATPNGANSILENKSIEFDMVLIDEAHHSPAPTWQQILINTMGAKQILFTATPFRMDGKEIKGDIIFKYSLSLAYQDEIFGEISYIPIDEDLENKDILIARKAEEIFLADKAQGYKHCIMVRTDTKEKAKILEELYSSETALRLRRIDSSMSNATAKLFINKLKNGEIDGIICVDMLGEGFDFPNLKIAAIHVAHKSLANTLQFIGRFARTNAADIGTAKFIAMNDEDLVIENKKLYVSDAIWQDIIIDISENKINHEVENKEYIEDYQQLVDEKETLSDFSLYGVRPSCHAKIYKVEDFDINGNFPENCNLEMKPYINIKENTIVAVGRGLSTPKWLDSDLIKNEEHLLYIVHYQKETRLLYIYSQIKSEAMYKSIVENFTSHYEKIPRYDMNRVLAGFNNFDIFNSGMLNRYNESGESYKISAGSDVSQIIDRSTGRMYSPGHVFCKANSEDSELTIGYSSGSKMWSSAYLSLQEYIKWCDYNGKKIANPKLKVQTGTNYDFLPMPQKLQKYEDNIFLVDFHGKTYSSAPLIMIKDQNESTIFITDLSMNIHGTQNDKVSISVTYGDIEEIIYCDLEGKCTTDQAIFFVLQGRDRISLSEYFNDNPIIMRTTDDSVIQGAEILKGDPNAIVYDNSNIIGIDWVGKYGTSIEVEVNDPVHHPTGKSIQKSLEEILQENSEYKYIIYDHSRGEMADYIAVRIKDNNMEVSLFHVKSKKGEQFNSSMGDLYEVVGQAIKSTIWLKSKQTLLNKMRSRRNGKHCSFIKGKFNEFSKEIKNSSLMFKGRIVIVQPAISKSVEMPLKYQEVLASANYYVIQSGKVTELAIYGSI